MNAHVLASRVSQWGEGPVWWQDHLYYVDIEGKKLIRFNPDSGDERCWEMGQRIGFALPCESGRWIWGGDQGMFFLDLETGISTNLLRLDSEIPDIRFNDAAISPDGRLFAGTISMQKITGSADLYRTDPDLSSRVVVPNVTNSNGIDWSPDGSTCYYIDTPTKRVLQFDYNLETGELSNRRICLSTESTYEGSPDGMTVDAEGYLWIAFCHGGCVVRFDPDSGAEVAKIDLPTAETTSCCFGGPNGRDLFITTGINSKKAEEQGGKVFVVKDAGIGSEQIPFADR